MLIFARNVAAAGLCLKDKTLLYVKFVVRDAHQSRVSDALLKLCAITY